MYRFLGLFLFIVGAAGGWWIGRPPVDVEKVPAAQAWQHYRAEAARAHVCEGDIDPHPAWFSLALAGSALMLLTATAHQPWRTWQIALGLRTSPSTVAVPW